MALEEYRRKRDFAKTREPEGESDRAHDKPIFVIQEHHATRLHYDFRLEADGVLKSWAVPKEPTLDPAQKRLAVQVEDHPLDYATFEGTIPKGQYGGGVVSIWDHGTYENLMAEKPSPLNVSDAIAAGHLEVFLAGERLKGRFALVRMKGRGEPKPQWLLIKMKDDFADPTDSEPSPPSKSTSTRKKKSGETPKRPPKTMRTHAKSHRVEVSNPDKVMYPDSGITKGEIFVYYERIADHLLPYLKDRPVTLERLPDGIGGEDAPHFWQKNTPKYYPDWIPRVELVGENGKTVKYALVNSLETLLYLVNEGTLTFHVWLSRVSNLDRPDYVLFDLDPSKATFADTVAVAKRLHAMLEGDGVESFLKTSGKAGLHVLTPWTSRGGFGDAREWARSVAERLASEMSDQATVEIRKASRGDRVYIDVMQNARGHHVVPPYVLRPVPGAPVSMPLEWSKLNDQLDPSTYNLKGIFRTLARRANDPLDPLLASFSKPQRSRR